MQEYKKLVFELFEERVNKTIANSSDVHAAILYSAMFNFAEKTVCIFCRNLKNSVFGQLDVQQKAEEFLQRKGNLYIALQEDPTESAFLRMILQHKFDENVKICKVGELFLKDGNSFNFSIMDNRAYRLEPNRNETKAIASANDVDFTSKLKSLFQTVTRFNVL